MHHSEIHHEVVKQVRYNPQVLLMYGSNVFLGQWLSQNLSTWIQQLTSIVPDSELQAIS